MTKIISVNAGSSSLKFQLFDMPSETVLTSGVVEKIGLEEGIFTIKVNGEKHVKNLEIPNHEKAVSLLLEALVEHGVVKDLSEIKGAGHRAVHGGEVFKESVKVDENVITTFESMSELAPLHNPAGLVGYRAFAKNLPEIGHTFVFDTAFHSTMDASSFLYPIPMEYYKEYKIRRYGFHGTSHKFVSERCIELLGNPEHSKVITCHLGNGASITAVKDGKSINTSMGFTPLAGIMMGTRSGDIDPAIVTFLQKKTGMSADEVEDVLNKKSGMLGVSGISSDARDIENACAEGNEAALLTTELYVNRVINTIGGYVAQLGGLDAMVFTGGIGENDTNIRQKICDALEEAFGIKLNKEFNSKTRGKEVLLSTEDSKVKVFLIPTNEELVIARDTYRILGF